jgi:hypothetical protein
VGVKLAWRIWRWLGVSGSFRQSVEGRRLPRLTWVGANVFAAY